MSLGKQPNVKWCSWPKWYS